MKKIALAILLALTSASALADSVEAFDNGTIQPAGPRTGSSGINFFNVEGVSNGNFASYGVARFDLTALKSGFDSLYGIGAWTVGSIALELTQSNAGFTTDGGVEVYFTDADSALSLQSSGLLYGNFASDFADAGKVISYAFAEMASGHVESHTLFDLALSNSAGAMSLAADILDDNIVTLALLEGDATVAATYAGFNNNTYAGPTLTVNVAAVPEADTWAMLAAGLGLVGLFGRRRRSLNV